MNLLPKHRKELKASRIHDHIINLNFESLAGQDAIEALLYAQMGEIGRGQKNPHSHQYVTSPVAKVLKRYKNVEDGGWWCSGIDPMSENWDAPMMWGCLKPDRPRRDANNPEKLIKYEHPPKAQTRAFFLRVSWEIGLKIAIKAGKEKEYRDRMVIGMDLSQEDKEFWGWVHEDNVPIILEEGAKKAAATLSAGYVAIGLPGVTGAVRTKNQAGEKVPPHLIAEINIFANEGREFSICFDHDTKQKTIKNVDREIGKLAELLLQAKCECRIIQLPGPEKGVDDFLVERGEEELDQLVEKAIGFRFWAYKKGWKLTYLRQEIIHSRYFGKINYILQGLMAVIGRMGVGKTHSLKELVSRAEEEGRKVLVLVHRIELGRGICKQIGLSWIDDIESREDRIVSQHFGQGMCVDRLHPHNNKTKFNPSEWEGAIVIIDEIEQVLWHMFNSATCYERRALILRTFEELIKTVISSGGLIIAQDADLSDASLDYLISISGNPNLIPYIVENTYKGEGRDITMYHHSFDATIVAIDEKIDQGQKVFFVGDSQKVKGKYSSINLECQLKKRHPDKRILRIDSETVGNPKHPAFACANRINDLLLDYDIVIATPTIGTGVSIDIRGHFDCVVGLFRGAIATNDVLQMMSRVRDESVEWHIWAAPYGCSKIGNGSSNDWMLSKSKDKVARKNLELLSKADNKFLDFDIDKQIDPRHTRAWAQFGARINAGQWNYRETIIELLKADNHRIHIAEDSYLRQEEIILEAQAEAAYNSGEHDECDRLQSKLAEIEQKIEEQNFKNKAMKTEAADIRAENRLNHAKKVSATPTPDKQRYEKLKEQRAKTPDELAEELKYIIVDAYATPDVTPELVIKHEDKWLPKIRLDYFLRNPEKARERDIKHLETALENGEGTTTLQDLKLNTAKIEILRSVNLIGLLNGEFYTKDSPEIQRIYSIMMASPWEFRDFIGFLPSPKKSVMYLVNCLLDSVIGVKLEGKQKRVDGKKERYYSFNGYKDDREAVWGRWEQKEMEYKESQINERMGVPVEHNNKIYSSDETLSEQYNPQKIIDQPTSVVSLEEEIGVIEVMVVEEVEAIAPTQPQVIPTAPDDGFVIAPPDQYWEDVMAYIYQGVSPIKQWIGRFVGVVSQPFQMWSDSPWFVQAMMRDMMGNQSQVTLPIALIG